MSEDIHEGGCLCGAVRYRIAGPLPPGGHCHCSMCRRSAGALVVTWTTVEEAQFTIVEGKPAVHASSEMAERLFCSACGSTLAFRSKAAPGVIDITVATLDHPENLPADRHVFWGNRMPWMHLDDHLPKYDGFTPDDHVPGRA